MANDKWDWEEIQGFVQTGLDLSKRSDAQASKLPKGLKKRRREVAFVKDLLQTRFPQLLRWFDCDARVRAQKVDHRGRPVGEPQDFVCNLATLGLDVYERMGNGRYKLWIAYRSPYESKWRFSIVDRFNLGPCSDDD
jgi:hypothetical protein